MSSVGCREVALQLGLEVAEGFLPAECCSSCHEDADEGYADLIWIEGEVQVCCTIYRLMSGVR